MGIRSLNRPRAFSACAVVALLICSGVATAHALPDTTEPMLTLNRLIRTSPFTGTSTSMSDNEGNAFVAVDDSLWAADDNVDAIYEINRTSGVLKRKISQSSFANAQLFGGAGSAGNTRCEDLEALAYDANADVLYALSGVTNAVPTIFRLKRDGAGLLQVESWQALSNEYTGAAWRLVDGQLYLSQGSLLRTYDYATNTFGSTFSISGISGIFGFDFDDTSGDLITVNTNELLQRASMTTRAQLPGWSMSMTGFGVADSRAVEVIGNHIYVSDGLDTRASTDTMNHAIFVLDVSGPGGPVSTPPTANFTTAPSSGTEPLNVAFTDTSTGNPTSWSWNFGDGGTSTTQSPTHTYAAGTFTAALTASNADGNNTISHTITVNPGVAPTASFSTSTVSGTRPLGVVFTDTSAGTPTSWSWDFGDGGTSTVKSPTYTYNTAGVFTSTLTATNSFGTSSASTTITVASGTAFTPVADAYVSMSKPTRNYGSATELRLGTALAYQYRSYLRFNVTGITATPQTVKLRLWVTSGSDRGGDWYVASNTWSESLITWNNAPALSGSPFAVVNNISTGTWIEIDVTSLVTGDGTYSFGALSTSLDTAKFGSRESAFTPELVFSFPSTAV